jgi:hypothetical protein
MGALWKKSTISRFFFIQPPQLSHPLCDAACMSEQNQATPSVHAAVAGVLKSIELGEPRMHEGIGLWPVRASVRPDPDYITLVEAQDLQGFKITEISESGSVPTLGVVNETEKNVLLFDGEELKGAKQNRILNTSILVAAGTRLEVPVSCTESGRWSHVSPDFKTSGSFAYAELRKVKARAVQSSLREERTHRSDQGEVWDEIERLHCMADTDGSSRTRAMNDAYRERERELEDFSRGMECGEGQCGLLVVVGDRVEGVDILSRPEAYAKFHRRLVESHAMDFLVRKGGKKKVGKVDPSAPARFLAEAAKATEEVHEAPGMGTDHRLRFRWGYGSALRVGETIVHLALFGGKFIGECNHPSEPRIRRRHHRRGH